MAWPNFCGPFAAAYTEDTYYNLDLAADRELTLADMLGTDWVDKCNAAVQAKMEQEPAACRKAGGGSARFLLNGRERAG